MATNGNTSHQEGYTAPPASHSTIDPSSSSTTSNGLSKDEVGWYFVEQYYTTMSRNPEKLHLFYGKKSQFVNGTEAELAHVSVGRQAIQERIKALEYQDCKVRISNVDSQGSLENIIVQVIGETSNNAAEPRKFVQTFVLAQQPSGYFVLNDILRYIKEEVEDDAEVPASDEKTAELEIAPETAAPVEPEAPAAEELPAAEPVHLDADVVDEKLAEVSAQDAHVSATEASSEPVDEPQPTEAKPEIAVTSADAEKTAQELAEEDAKKTETPKDPSPTPVVTRAPAAAPAPAEPEKPKGPPKPMTWANRAAAAAGPARPAVAVPVAKPAAATATPAQARAPAPAATQPPAQPAQASEATSATAAAPAAAKDSGDEWQTAGADSKRQNRPVSVSGPPANDAGTMAYIKYVTEKVKAEDLKSHLESFGELAYFDINRAKNCAFVEFKTQTGYNAAVQSNPHVVNGENIVVEQRRPKANAYGGSNYSANRGGVASRGRGGFESNRGGQGGARGGFVGQGRGGRGGAGGAGGAAPGGATRGRGASQTANA